MNNPTPPHHNRHVRRIPTKSVFYDRIMPMLFIGLAIVMIVLIIIAMGVLLGFVHYN